jgi:hypothetical protein
MTSAKILSLAFALGLLGATAPAQAAPLSAVPAGVAIAQPNDVLTVQHRRDRHVGARRGGGRYVGRGGHHRRGWHGGGAVGAGIAAGIIGAAAGAIIANEAQRAPQCQFVDPYTRERYWGPC